MGDDPIVTSSKPARKPTKEKKKSKRTRRTTLFPASSFEEALTIPNAIQKHAAGQKVRRLTLFGQMGKSPDSGPSRQLIINANKYGLITGNYSSEHLELTPDGKLATSNEATPREKLAVRFKLAIEKIPPFKELYEAQKGNRLPASSVLEDLAREKGIPAEDAKECVEMFIVNAKFLGILKPIAGAERIIPIDQALEDIPSTVPKLLSAEVREASTSAITPTAVVQPEKEHNWDDICFYISPIGEENSDHRIHADLFLGSLVEPGLEEFGLKVVRADRIGKPGMITAQILEYILKSRLVIADLSFHNPNVFYIIASTRVSVTHRPAYPQVRQNTLRPGPIPYYSNRYDKHLYDGSESSVIQGHTGSHGPERPGFCGQPN